MDKKFRADQIRVEGIVWGKYMKSYVAKDKEVSEEP